MSVSIKQISVVILAGGRGTRVDNADKGLLDYQQKSLIEYALAAITPHTKDIRINANRNLSRYQQYGYPVFSDSLPDHQGPLAGIYTAMQQTEQPYLAILPCDTPLLDITYLPTLLQHATPEHINYCHDGNHAHYLHALIPYSLHDSLHTFFQYKKRQVKAWYQQHPCHEIDVSQQAEHFRNFNRLQDFK